MVSVSKVPVPEEPVINPKVFQSLNFLSKTTFKRLNEKILAQVCDLSMKNPSFLQVQTELIKEYDIRAK